METRTSTQAYIRVVTWLHFMSHSEFIHSIANYVSITDPGRTHGETSRMDKVLNVYDISLVQATISWHWVSLDIGVACESDDHNTIFFLVD